MHASSMENMELCYRLVKPLLASGLMESTMDRIKMKAKRNIKAIAKDVPNGATGVIQTARKWKNSRRPRNGYRPKKDRKGRRPVQDTYQLFFKKIFPLNHVPNFCPI